MKIDVKANTQDEFGNDVLTFVWKGKNYMGISCQDDDIDKGDGQ